MHLNGDCCIFTNVVSGAGLIQGQRIFGSADFSGWLRGGSDVKFYLCAHERRHNTQGDSAGCAG